MTMNLSDGLSSPLDQLLEQEWIVSNRLGGYASSTIVAMNTRKYHGLLVAAMAPPVRRIVLLSRVEETIHHEGWPTALACNEYPGTVHPRGHESLRGFSCEPFPRWSYAGEGWAMEKSLQLLHGQNTVVLSYTLLCARVPVEMELRPLLALRPIHDLMYQWTGQLGAHPVSGGAQHGGLTESPAAHHRVPPTARTPEVFFAHDGAFTAAGHWYFNTIYRCEQDRGYAGLEDLWSPGAVKWALEPGQTVHFVCSTEPIDLAGALASARQQSTTLDMPIVDSPLRDTDHDLLVRAAQTFIVDPPAAFSMMTKLPWSAPSLREALIALPGILLVTGEFDHAKSLLNFAASRLSAGLIPTELTETAQVQFIGADTSLWFINALWQYLRYTGDEATAQKLLDLVLEIISRYQHGTKLGIHTDASRLLVTRSPGRATTWMDAKIGDWVVTPRPGRPVEINALWFNAVCIAAELCRHFGRAGRAMELDLLAASIQKAFNARFRNAHERCCFDVVDDHGSDPSIRPNQLLAVSLPFAVLSIDRHAAVLECVRHELMTPFGPRTLAASDPSYHGRYGGDVVARDRALHQGSVHPWLLGQFVSAQMRVLGRGKTVRDDCRQLLQGCLDHMRGTGLGQLCELFDGDAPHSPGGAIACATSVGELLRCYVEDILDLQPTRGLPSMQAKVTVSLAPSPVR
jgi:predicted glycogen debranching enzyme